MGVSVKPVTVIIPNYNGIQYLGDCLQSLLRNDKSLFDVLVVDNASTDGSRAAAERLEAAGEPVRLVRMDSNTGFTGAVNAGIQEAQTPYVLLLNDDTTVAEDFVARLLAAAGECDRVFSVGARMLSMREPDKLDDAGDEYCALGWAYARGRGRPGENARYNRRREVFAACAGAALYDRRLLLEIGGFDGNHFAYLEDIDIGYRARIRGYRNYYEPGAVVLHAGSAVSGSRHNAFKVSLSSRNSIYLVYKNMPLLQLLLNLPFLALGFAAKALFFARKGLGMTYLKGLWQGVRLALSKEGREHKVAFRPERLMHYLRIQFLLLYNMIVLLREF